MLVTILFEHMVFFFLMKSAGFIRTFFGSKYYKKPSINHMKRTPCIQIRGIICSFYKIIFQYWNIRKRFFKTNALQKECWVFGVIFWKSEYSNLLMSKRSSKNDYFSSVFWNYDVRVIEIRNEWHVNGK